MSAALRSLSPALRHQISDSESLANERGATMTETALSIAIVVAVLIVAVKYAEQGVLFRATRANSLYGDPSILPPCERSNPPVSWGCP